jgi:hypothetical protein
MSNKSYQCSLFGHIANEKWEDVKNNILPYLFDKYSVNQLSRETTVYFSGNTEIIVHKEEVQGYKESDYETLIYGIPNKEKKTFCRSVVKSKTCSNVYKFLSSMGCNKKYEFKQTLREYNYENVTLIISKIDKKIDKIENSKNFDGLLLEITATCQTDNIDEIENEILHISENFKNLTKFSNKI